MAECKDCLYFPRCVVLGVELDMKHSKEADKNCRHFKNKADLAEVVRCKDCESYNGHRYCKYHASTVLDNDFCSYGQNKVDKKTHEQLSNPKIMETIIKSMIKW